MIQFTTTLYQFEEQGEKTGWTYIEITAEQAHQLKPNNKKSFRVKGKLDDYAIKGVALLPMGNGGFIMAVNAEMRKGIHKKKGAQIKVQLQLDKEGYQLNKEFIECINDEPAAKKYFESLAKGHQNYFSKWIESAKTEPTRTRRIAEAVTALSQQKGFPEMVRALKQKKDELGF